MGGCDSISPCWSAAGGAGEQARVREAALPNMADAGTPQPIGGIMPAVPPKELVSVAKEREASWGARRHCQNRRCIRDPPDQPRGDVGAPAVKLAGLVGMGKGIKP